MMQTILSPWIDWKICRCSEACKRACRLTQNAGMEDPNPLWADIGYHPPWLICGHMGE